MSYRAIVNLVVSTAILFLGGCERLEQMFPRDSAKAYSECLQAAVKGTHYLSADDIRSLCAESSGVADTRYKYESGKLVPSNDFTRCYEEEVKLLKTKGVPQAERLAKVSCRFPQVGQEDRVESPQKQPRETNRGESPQKPPWER